MHADWQKASLLPVSLPEASHRALVHNVSDHCYLQSLLPPADVTVCNGLVD